MAVATLGSLPEACCLALALVRAMTGRLPDDHTVHSIYTLRKLIYDDLIHKITAA